MSGWLSVGVLAILMSACSEVSDSFSDGPSPSASSEDAIAFSTTVSSIQQATRADATIVNKGETMLLPTLESNRKVGIFGCYTGPYTWAELVALSKTEFAGLATLMASFPRFSSELSGITEAAFDTKKEEILNKYYSANQMFNVPATINEDGTLTYTPLQFWSNNPLPTPSEGHEYMTFWAYYPYNESSTLGEYGISMYNDENGIGVGKGMGKVKFTMHADAAHHNDFLISAPVVDCNRDKYPLQRTDNPATYDPKPVQFHLYHMLAQVRFYTYIRGDDKMVYQKDDVSGNDQKADATWLSGLPDGTTTIIDDYGNVYDIVKSSGSVTTITNQSLKAVYPADPNVTLTEELFLNLDLKVPDEEKCVRWLRTEPAIWDISHKRRRANITYELQMNNIRTTAEFYPNYTPSGTSIKVDESPTLGSVTVNDYIMNPYWFTFHNGQRVRLNDNYMFDYFEDTPVGEELNATSSSEEGMAKYDDIDGIDWSKLGSTYDVTARPAPTDPLYYLQEHHENLHPVGSTDKHYNYSPGNILLVVPQELKDEDVPHVIITAKGKRAVWNNTEKKWTEGETLTAKVTVNLLKMGISWESGYIYCYAFLDDLKPGDDKVRGPESITVLFNKDWYTDQW